MPFRQETADEICRRLAEGESLRSVCRDPEMPGRSEVFRWLADDAHIAFRDQYARAREEGNAAEFEELVEIADAQPERDDKGRVDPGWVAWQRGRVDVRKWSLSKKEPKKYGDKLDMNLAGSVSVSLRGDDAD